MEHKDLSKEQCVIINRFICEHENERELVTMNLFSLAVYDLVLDPKRTKGKNCNLSETLQLEILEMRELLGLYQPSPLLVLSPTIK